MWGSARIMMYDHVDPGDDDDDEDNNVPVDGDVR